MEGPTIGIDLGTTFSCVAVYKNGEAKIIPLENGSNTMPSCVSFEENGGRKIGEEAKNDSILNPTNTITGVKRYIGCRFDDPELQDIEKYLYEIFNEDGNPKIKISVNGEENIFAPEEISSMVLGKLKEYAEAYLKTTVSKAVITVPAHFKDSQRQATKDAGRIIGLDILRIINEPTAAALAFGIQDKYKDDIKEKNVIVYDFGGGTFDVSIISIENGIFEVKSTNGDTHLGGDDIDLRLVEHFREEFRNKFNEDLAINPRAIRRLRLQCEKIKRTLSTELNAPLDLPVLHNSHDFYSAISRNKFEELCNDIFTKTLTFLEEALKQAKLNASDIDDILLVGGSTRIPKVKELVKNFFNDKDINTTLNPDEAVAIGASVQAAILDGEENKYTGELLLLDVTPLSLGVGTAGGVMSIIIPRNTQIPVKVTNRYSNEKDYQTKVKIEVFEGERGIADGNAKLGSFILCDLKPQPRGKAHIDVTFQVDSNGILYVTAEEKRDDKNCILTVQIDKGRLDEEQIARMISTAQRYAKEDEKHKKIIAAKIDLENYCYTSKQKAETLVTKDNERGPIIKLCDETIAWIENTVINKKETYEEKKKDIYAIIQPVLKNYL